MRLVALAALAVLAHAGARASGVTVTLSQPREGSAQVQVRGAPEPVLVWSGARAAPYLVALSWEDEHLGLEQALPDLKAGPVRRLDLKKSPGGTRLEIEVGQDVWPRLRQSGGAWVLQLDAVAVAAPVDHAPQTARPQTLNSAQPQKHETAQRAPAQGRDQFLLDVLVNGTAVADAVRADRLADGRLVLAEPAWRAARLRPPAEEVPLGEGEPGAHPLDAAPGVSYRLDAAQLRLEISALPQAFDGTRLTIGDGRPGMPATPEPGAYLNYDVSGIQSAAGHSVSGFLETVAFNAWGSLVAGGLISAGHDGARYVRTETYVRRDWPGRMESLVIGDTISSAGAWSRPVRFGGVRWGRDFSLSPGFITMPLPTVTGSAALPSMIDVLVNQQKQASTPVPPGPFALANVPVVNGAGELNVVVRDPRGVETVLSQAYYAAPALLAEGLSDFSFEAGALREHFGTSSADYGAAFASGSYRRGVSPALTLGARAEAQRDRQAAGIEAQAVLADWAVAQGALAVSHTPEGGTGVRSLAAIERVTPRGGLSLSWEHFSEGFREFGVDEVAVRPRDRLRVGGGWRIDERLTLGASYARQLAWNGPAFSLAGATLGVRLGANAFLSLYAARQSQVDGWTVGANLVVALESRRTVSSSVVRPAGGAAVATAQLTQAAPQGPGWGWSARAGSAAGRAAQGSAILNTNHAQFTADLNAGRDNTALRLGANGSVGWLDGTWFASRRIDQGAFAVVSVGDLEGVQVSRSNQVVATTDATGRAVVTNLLPYQSNQLTVDAAQLPLDTDVRTVRQDVVPFARAGVKIAFDVQRSRNLLLVLVGADGQPLAPGTRVRLQPRGREFIVALRGEVYLTDVQPGETAIDVAGPAACRLALPIEPSTPPESKIGPLACAQ